LWSVHNQPDMTTTETIDKETLVNAACNCNPYFERRHFALYYQHLSHGLDVLGLGRAENEKRASQLAVEQSYEELINA
jgi:hypothetical protein